MIDKPTLENYYEILRTKFKLKKELLKHYERTLSPQFNSFYFWWRWIDENKVSEILAYFLDPKETHAQGKIFLKLFLKSVGLDYDCENCAIEVKKEYPTDENRRIDIVVIFNKGEYVIGIENKIYENTTDQSQQIKHYSEFLEKISKNNFTLLYLSPMKKALSEDSISSNDRDSLVRFGKLKMINYEEHIISCVHQFSLNSESDRVRAFILDFEKTLKHMYLGEKFMDDHDLIVDFALNSQNLETTLKVGFATGEIKRVLKDRFYSQCEDIAKKFDLKTSCREPYDWFKFFPSKWNNHNICFYFEGGGLKYGICRNFWSKEKTRMNEIEEILGGRWNVSNWFLCEIYLYRNFENDANGWLDIENGKLKEQVYDFVKRIMDNAEIMNKGL